MLVGDAAHLVHPLAAQGLKVNGLLVKPLARDMLEKKVAGALAPLAKPAAKRALGAAS